MGGKNTQTAQQNSVTKPYDPAIPALDSILAKITGGGATGGATTMGASPGGGGFGKTGMGVGGAGGGLLGNTDLTGAESGALDALSANAAGGNPFAPAIGSLATDLLGGGVDRTGRVGQAEGELRTGLLPYTSMSTDPYSNPAFTKFSGGLMDDITDRIKSSYAGAGYSPVASGDFSKQLGEGIARGVAPSWLQAHNDLESRKGNAIRDMFSAGNTSTGLLSSLDQITLGNRQAGVGAAQSAMQANDSPYVRALQIEAQRRGIPVDNLARLLSIVAPIGSMGGTKDSTTTTTSPTDPWGKLIGAGLMGAGFMTGNPMLAMSGAGSLANGWATGGSKG